jgi:hypothetical protein
MKLTQIIEMASKRTERRADKVLDLMSELMVVIQDFCLEHQWEWREKTVTFNTAMAQQEYDMAVTAPDIEEIIAMQLVRGTDDVKRLTRLFDVAAQGEAMEAIATGEPTMWFRKPGAPLILVFSPVPNSVYKMRMTYWAVPVGSPDTFNDVVPLVPEHLHRVLVKGLEKQIFRYTLGESSTQYQAAKADYDSELAKAATR